MEIAALVLGIIGLVLSLFGSSGGISFICSVLAIIFGAISLKKEGSDRGKAKAGLILGIISLALGVVLLIVCSSCVALGFSFLADFFDLYL